MPKRADASSSSRDGTPSGAKEGKKGAGATKTRGEARREVAGTLSMEANYPKVKVYTDFVAVGSAAALTLGCIARIGAGVASLLRENDGGVTGIVLVVIAMSAWVAGMAAADVASGLVHWALDTWGSLETPVLGSTFIRAFREHHVDPLEFSRHHWAMINGDNCTVTLPVLLWAFFGARTDTVTGVAVLAFLTATAIMVGLTNQIHAWAHVPKPPAFVKKLQKAGIILTHSKHHEHHIRPWDTSYCITTGWMNGPLNAVGFWKGLENAIVMVTGAVPRADDLKWTAAAQLAEKNAHKAH